MFPDKKQQYEQISVALVQLDRKSITGTDTISQTCIPIVNKALLILLLFLSESVSLGRTIALQLPFRRN